MIFIELNHKTKMLYSKNGCQIALPISDFRFEFIILEIGSNRERKRVFEE